MSALDNKKSKRRKLKKGSVTKAATQNKAPTPDANSYVDGEDQALKQLEQLMDAQEDENAPFKMLPFPRGSNPFLDRERCLLCNRERQDPPEADKIKAESEDKQSSDTNPLSQLPLWVCPSCRKAADQEIDKKPIEQFLMPDEFGESFLPDISIKSGSEPTTPNGSICSCAACQERRIIESEHEQETADLQQSWMELRKVVRRWYGNRDDTDDLDNLPDQEEVKDLVHKLCSRDPHQLFLRLESQVREFVIEMKVRLLKQLSTGFKTPPQARKFISMLLEEYAHLCKIARRMSGLLTELQEHLKRFKVTWDLHNKHLFQSVVFSEPSIKNSINLLISQLRVGAASKESYTEDAYPNLLHRYLKFDDEMSVINVVWRDCRQLLESYNEEQSALKLKQKMLREDWEFFKTQRKLLEQQVSKNPKASLSHNLEAQFTETMRLMLQGNKPSQEELSCPRCNRKRCPCDECTITHLITCGIINPDVLETANNPTSVGPHHNFLHDPNRYRIDVSPPSMSSTTSSSGSSSPIMVDRERLTTLPYQDTHMNEECQEEGDNQSYDEDDDEEEEEEDEEEDGEEDEDADNEEEEEEDSNDKDDISVINSLPTLKGMVEINLPLGMGEEGGAGKLDTCNCEHCVSQAKLEQVKLAEDNQCQCHVCLQQQGKAISTSLPQHVPPIVPRPGELHLYPHIHGSTGLHSLGRGHVRPILQPNLYDLHLPTSHRHKSIMQQTKVPIKLDFDTPEGINDHFYHAYGEWDNTTYDPRLLLGSGKYDSELLPPPPFTSHYTSTLLSEPLPLSVPGVFSTASAPSVPSSTSNSAFISSMASHSKPGTNTQASTKITDNLSVLTTKETMGEQVLKTSRCSNQGSPVKSHTPPCARPVTMGGNNTPKVTEKATHNQHCRKHNPQAAGKTGSVPNHNHTGPLPVKMTPEFMQTKEGRQIVQQFANKLKQPNLASLPCNHGNNKSPGHTPGNRENHTVPGSCQNSVQLPTTANNVSVGTSTVCAEPDCDGSHDDNYDSIDDNCSEKSSSTSNSTSQKEGKYCDCCYCEFFGHGNPPMAPTSKNYAEMRDKLRLRLKKKNTLKTDPIDMKLSTNSAGSLPVNQRNITMFESVLQNEIKPDEPHSAKCLGVMRDLGGITCHSDSSEKSTKHVDPLDSKGGLDELIKFINGTDESTDKKLSAKAAKRARQKQRKAEEKARQEEERLRAEREQLQREEEAKAAALQKQASGGRSEPLTRKQKKQAAKLAKSSSSSPTPVSTGNTPVSSGNTTDTALSASSNTVSKNLKKKGKHKDTGETLQVNITCEIEHNSEPASSNTSRPASNNSQNHSPSSLQNHKSSSKSNQSVRPNPQGSSDPATTHIPAVIDNRIIINTRPNKNKEPGKPINHVGNGDEVSTTINAEQIAQITRQQQELLKKQTQQLIQLKLQQEAKKQLQMAQQQQQKQQQQQQQQQSGDSNKKKQPAKSATVQRVAVTPEPEKSQQSQQVRNNMKVSGRGGNNTPTPPQQSPRQVQEQNNNNSKQNSNKASQFANSQPMVSLHQSQNAAGASQGKKMKKSGDVAQVHNHVMQPTRHTPSPVTSNLQNGTRSPTKGQGQVRQPPQGQARNGDVAAVITSPDKRTQEQLKGRQEESPPSDQGKNTGKNKKMKKRSKGAEDINFIDEVFMPKSESDIEGGEMDDFEREIEEFKRFCADSTPVKREKLQVNVNIKDIFAKKKAGLSCS